MQAYMLHKGKEMQEMQIIRLVGHHMLQGMGSKTVLAYEIGHST